MLLDAMDDRAKIPGLALLSLSFTTCVDRSNSDDPDVDPIVGDWHAIEIDGDKFPMVYSEAPYFLQSGGEVSVTADLKGRFVLVQERATTRAIRAAPSAAPPWSSTRAARRSTASTSGTTLSAATTTRATPSTPTATTWVR